MDLRGVILDGWHPVRDGLFPFPSDSARQFLRLVCFRFSHQPLVFKAEGILRQQLKRVENRTHRADSRLTMKSQLIAIVAAVLVVGCGPSMSIHDAARDGNIKAVKQHLAAGTDVNAKGDIGRTPLHLAAWKGHKEVTALLIAKGADVNAKYIVGDTPLDFAMNVKGGREIADLLRKHGGKTGEELKAAGKSIKRIAEAATPEPTTAKAPRISIREAAFRGNLEAVKQHIAAGEDVNAKGVNGYTPLDMANGKEIADLLRKHGGKTREELKADGN